MSETEFDFAARVGRVEPSATLAISNLASELEAAGKDVVDLSVGEPDFPTPENVTRAAKSALDDGHTGYTPSNGIPELRSAIAEKLNAQGIPAESDNVVVTPGGKQALFEVINSLIDDGDEVVLLDPAWVSYEAIVKLANGSLNRVDLAPYDFQLEPALDDLAAAVSDETEMVIVNSPSNPTGAVYSEAAFEGVRDLAVEHDFLVVSDEMYEEITYGVEQPSMGALDGMEDRCITVNGFSKAYSMTGWRLGYYAAHEDVIAQTGKLHSHSVSCATNFVQRAGVEALADTEEAIDEMVEAFRERRDMLVDRFDDEGVDVPVGDGAFYMMLPVDAECEALRGSEAANGDEPIDQAWCEGALEDAHVATVPGSAFGSPGYARISYAASEERLREAVDRLAEHGYL